MRQIPCTDLGDVVTVLVNSCDAFADCWNPFFSLLSTYWNAPWPRVLLNTERRSWTHDRVPVESTSVQTGAARLTWSECLARALDLVETPLLLYLQEDYFIEQPIRVDVIAHCVSRMNRDPSVSHIGLTDFGSEGPFEETDDVSLWRISPNGRYRVSLQAGLWRVEALRRYLRPHEDAWMFEIFGTRRARRLPGSFLTLSRTLFRRPQTSVLSYEKTGIIKGRWHSAIPALFAEHQLSVDFAVRGFYTPVSPIRRRVQTLMTVLQWPTGLLRSL